MAQEIICVVSHPAGVAVDWIRTPNGVVPPEVQARGRRVDAAAATVSAGAPIRVQRAGIAVAVTGAVAARRHARRTAGRVVLQKRLFLTFAVLVLSLSWQMFNVSILYKIVSQLRRLPTSRVVVSVSPSQQ